MRVLYAFVVPNRHIPVYTHSLTVETNRGRNESINCKAAAGLRFGS